MVSKKVVVVVVVVLIAALFPYFEGKLYGIFISWSMQILGGRTPVKFNNDSLHVVFCGTGGPLFEAERAGPCTAIIVDEEIFIIDVGPGSWESIARLGLDATKISTIFLTHLHSDHIGDLGELSTMSWTMGREKPIIVYGPEGTETVIDGFDSIYQFDISYRIQHHGEDILIPEGRKTIGHNLFTDPNSKDFIITLPNGLKVTTFDVNHEPVIPAFGYRFDYKGASVVISGDTSYSENLVQHSQNVDIIVHDTLNDAFLELLIPTLKKFGNTRTAKIMTDVLDYHAGIEKSLEVAENTNTRVFVCSHLLFAQNWFLHRWFYLNVVTNWHGNSEIILAKDGLHIGINLSTKEITTGKLGMYP